MMGRANLRQPGGVVGDGGDVIGVRGERSRAPGGLRAQRAGVVAAIGERGDAVTAAAPASVEQLLTQPRRFAYWTG